MKYQKISANRTTSKSSGLLPPASEGWRKVMFSLCPPLQGGTPFPGAGGTPFPGPGRGYPLPRWGGYPLLRSRWGRGVPHLRRGTPTWEGVPPAWEGVPPLSRSDPRMGVPPSWSSIACTCYVAGGVASCVHAGGLSCWQVALVNVIIIYH